MNDKFGEETFKAHISRWTGIADQYHLYRPRAPIGLIDLIHSLAGSSKLQQVVDLGCGTGLSTWHWADKAHKVIGVDPGPDMLRQAKQSTSEKPEYKDIVQFQEGYSHDTHLESNSTDIITCSQCLHWMEPRTTFIEVNRVLKPGGIFAAYDYDVPGYLVGFWEVLSALNIWLEDIEIKIKDKGISQDTRKQKKEQHLQRLKESGQFRYTSEILYSYKEEWKLLPDQYAEKLVKMGLTFGHVQIALREKVISEEDADKIMEKLKGIVRAKFSEYERDQVQTFVVIWSYRIRFGIK